MRADAPAPAVEFLVTTSANCKYCVMAPTPITVKQALERVNIPAWAFRRSDDDQVLFFDGDTSLDTLALDFDSNDTGTAHHIIVNGSLRVNGPIANSETDGAVSLFVLGNLSADSIAIGGQVVWVKGNVEVNSVCLGEYNHGEMLIEGDFNAALVICDDYHFGVNGAFAAPYVGDRSVCRIGPEGWDWKSERSDVVCLPITALIPDVLGEYGLDTPAIRNQLHLGANLLNNDPPEDERYRLTMEIDPQVRYGTAVHLDRLQHSSLFDAADRAAERAVESISLWDGGIFMRVTRPHHDDEGAYSFGSAYIQFPDVRVFWSRTSDTDAIALLGQRGGDLHGIEHEDDATGAEVAMRLIYRAVMQNEWMLERTPIALIHTAVETLLEDDDDEADHTWVEVHRADADDDLGDRIRVIGSADRWFIFEAEGSHVGRYTEHSDDEGPQAISIENVADQREAEALFHSAVRYLSILREAPAT
jgi:hypothetical protein